MLKAEHGRRQLTLVAAESQGDAHIRSRQDLETTISALAGDVLLKNLIDVGCDLRWFDAGGVAFDDLALPID